MNTEKFYLVIEYSNPCRLVVNNGGTTLLLIEVDGCRLGFRAFNLQPISCSPAFTFGHAHPRNPALCKLALFPSILSS